MVSGISNSLAADQLNTLALSSMSRNVQNTTSNLDLPSDEVTLQSGDSASSGGVNDVHQAYDGLRQIGNQPDGLNTQNLPDGTHQAFGGPIRHLDGTPMPADPGKHFAEGNPIQQHLPISAVNGHNTMPPVYDGGVSVSA
ncbi:MAG TPA: hypothetical protein VMT67_03375 [Terriglobales bacterium]|nr:hypothetical protein [Terriglobales bacterium]